MLTLSKLFGRSPFAPLLQHMELVSSCVHKIPALFAALEEGNEKLSNEIALEISKLEHKADLTKNDIRNHLPKTLFLSLVDRTRLLEILSIQDGIADAAEDVAKIVTLKSLKMLPAFQPHFTQFVQKNLEAFEKSHDVIKELNDLVESSFGGIEAEKVRTMVEEVAKKEHEADLLQHQILKALVDAEEELTYSEFFIWQSALSLMSAISDLSEKLANRIRMTLDIK